MSIERDFEGTFKDVLRDFTCKEGLVTLERRNIGIFVCFSSSDGTQYIPKVFSTMFFAKRFYNRLYKRYGGVL